MTKIFESPDGGKTIKSRDPRYVTESGQYLGEHLKENQLWRNIRKEAETNKVLQEALDRAIMIYHLSKKENGKST